MKNKIDVDVKKLLESKGSFEQFNNTKVTIASSALLAE